MKQTWIIILGFVALVSCTYKGQQNDIESQEELEKWYYDVFNKATEDTTTTIPDYAYSTDWMQRYAQYIDENFGLMNFKELYARANLEYRGDDIWITFDTAKNFDCRYWTMAYVDDDTIPEMYLYGGCWASGALILTQYGGKVYDSSKCRCAYIKGANGLLHSQWKHGDDIWGMVYEMKNGKFTELVSYGLFTYFVDTSKVGDYGLTLDSLKRHYTCGEIGDTVVGVSEIVLNGKRIGTCFGYDQCVRCTGFAQVKQKLDALYYSKGTNTYFPNVFNTEKESIASLYSIL